MKLPEYDNRPGPGELLYRDPADDKGAWEDIKFPAIIVGLVIGLILSLSLFFKGLAAFFRDLLRVLN